MSIPDARRSGPGVAWREQRTSPRQAPVRVRIGGQWRKGRIIEWVTEPGTAGWDCVILADEPPAACRGKAGITTIRRRPGSGTATRCQVGNRNGMRASRPAIPVTRY